MDDPIYLLLYFGTNALTGSSHSKETFVFNKAFGLATTSAVNILSHGSDVGYGIWYHNFYWLGVGAGSTIPQDE